MRLITFLFLFSILSPLRAAEKLEAWSTLFFQHEPTNAPSKSTITLSSGSLIAQLGLSGGGIICVGDAQDRMAAWSFKHRAYAPIAGVAPIETDLSEILKMEVLGYSEVGSARPPSDTPPKRPLRLGWVTSNRTVKVTFKPSADCESELWGVMRVNYTVTQYAGSLEASWVPSSVSLKLGGVWTPRGGGPAGSAVMLLTMGAFKSVAADSIQVSATQVKVAGQSAVLNGNITGSEAMSYQWFKDGVAVVGGTSSSLVIPALGPVHAGNYRVEARNGFGAVQRSYVTLAVFGFTQQPQGASVVVGAPITLSAQAQGGESPVSYQWYKGAQLVTGATGSVLSIGSATLANAGTYSVKASAGGATLTSNSVQVSVRENIALDVSDNFSTGISSSRWTTYQKLSGSMNVVGASGHASFLVSSSSIGSQDAAMVWNARLRTDVDWTAEFRGRNNAPYSANGGSKLGLEIMDARLLNSGTINAEYGDRYLGVKFTRGSEGYREPLFQYWVNDSWQQDISAATVTEFKFKAVYQAADQTFNFLVETTGAGSDWKLIGTSSLYELVPDATASSELLLLINGKTRYGPISEGQLWVDDFRLIQAAAAMPTITTQPSSKTATVGGSVTLSVTASGYGTLSYQWRKDGVNIAGATGSSYSIASVQSTNAGSYAVVVSNANGSVTSQSARLSVATPVEVRPGMILVSGGTLPAYSQLGAVPVDTFYIGKTEVTWGEWKTVRTWAVVNGYTDLANVGQGLGDAYPVTHVNWHEVVKWCNARSEKEGKTPVYKNGGEVHRTGTVSDPQINSSANGYRLPSEKEWEFAARGGTQTQGYTYSGSNDLSAVGWYNGNSGGAVKEVGKKQANELGIYDMSGNVWEWSGSLYPGYEGSYRVIRGGGWGSYAEGCSVSYRDPDSPGNRDGYIGFRVALSSVP